jgi:glycosyltransferase involved in cell wall biosynthesis
MRVVIFEPDLTGHHAPYLRHLLSSLAELEVEAIVLTSRGASQSRQFALHLRDATAGATWDECLDQQSISIRYTARLVGELLAGLKRHHADHGWAPFADYLSLYLGARAMIGRRIEWPPGVQTEGLCFRSTFAYPAPHWRKHLGRTASRLFLPRANWDILHFLDPIPYQLTCKKFPEHAHRFRLMPDPVESTPPVDMEAAREKLGIPISGRYIGCMGVLNNRTALERLLLAFRQAKLQGESRLLMAGPMSETVRDCVDRRFGDLVGAGRVVTIDRHLNLDEVALAVSACDVVCVPTKFRTGSSSFIVRAAAAGKPVVADDFGWTGWAIGRFELGWRVDVRNISRFASTLRSAVENVDSRTPSPAAERFVRFHSAENFKAHWTSRLRERRGLPADPNYVSWEWVLDESVAVGTS